MFDNYPVKSDGATYFIDYGPHSTKTLLRNGSPDLGLLPGWLPSRVLYSATNFSILELIHENGSRASWLLSPDLKYVGNDVSALPEEVRRLWATEVSNVKEARWRNVVGLDIVEEGTFADGTYSADALLGLLLTNVNPFEPPVCQEIVVDGLSEATLAEHIRVASGNNTTLSFNLDVIRNCLQKIGLDTALEALLSGAMHFPSPVDGSAAISELGLVLNRSVSAYRCVDRKNALSFFVLQGLWAADTFALYIPAYNIVLYRDNIAKSHAFEHLGMPIATAIAKHIDEYYDSITKYADRTERTFGLLFHQAHLGHHLWNELTCLQPIVAQVPFDRLPKIFVLEPRFSEMYGKVDSLYPEFNGKVDRHGNFSAFVRDTYAQGVTILRANTNYVSRALAGRIINYLEASPGIAQAESLYRELRDGEGVRFVLLGLRVENRTLSDWDAFAADLVEFLASKLGNVAIVVDGHNSVDNIDGVEYYVSHAETSAKQSPIEIEQHIVDTLIRRFAGDKRVRVINNVGDSMARSIYWCNRSDLFITPWGAGLAKYRWVCNKHGLVLAGNRFVAVCGEQELHLYDSQKFMESPTQLEFNTRDEVQDEPQADLTIDLKSESRWNFRVLRGPLFFRVERMLIAPTRGGSMIESQAADDMPRHRT